MGLQEHARIFPFIDNPYPVFKKCSLFVLSSTSEGLSYVILEAMKIGVPVLSTDCWCGPRELISGQTESVCKDEGVVFCDRGVIVSNAEAENSLGTCFMAKGMAEILSEPKRADTMVANASEFVNTTFDRETIANHWIKLIDGYSYNMEQQEICLAEREDEIISNAESIAIYGAGSYGRAFLSSVKKSYAQIYFVVSNKEGNPEKVNGIDVLDIDELRRMYTDIPIVLCVDLFTQHEVERTLIQKGFQNILYPHLQK